MKSSSPFRDSRTAHTTSHQQQYQEEFWKLKAQRLEAKNEELAKENQALLKKNIDSSKRQQELIDKLAAQTTLDRSRSRRKDEKDKPTEGQSAARDEIEKLGKQLRVLKNQHSLELTKATQECKKLKKKVNELETKLLSSVPAEEHANKIQAVTEELTTLTKRLAVSEQQLERLRDEKKKLLSDNDALTKELNQMKVREKAAQKQEEQNLMDLRKYERFIHQYKSEKQQSTSQIELKQEQTFNYAQGATQSTNQILQLRKQVQALEKEKESNRKLLIEASSWENEKTRCEVKMKQMECEVADAKAELKNVLSRLSPLLAQKAEYKGKENVQAKASLTLLEIFLKKYKIQAF